MPAIGCGLGLVTVPRFVVFADKRGREVGNVVAAAETTALEAKIIRATKKKKKKMETETSLKNER